MRQLKTPEEIKREFTLNHGYTRVYQYSESEVNELILSAQRDALECAGESTKSFIQGGGSVPGSKVVSNILNLLPKI